MNRMRLGLLALLPIAMSCGDPVGPGQPSIDLSAAHQRWQSQNLHTYAFTIQRSCFCANVHPLYVVVLKDTVAGVIDLETGTQVDRRYGETVEGLFTFVQTAIERPARLIRVTYDVPKGFPTEIDYDGSAQVADDEIYFRVTDVHPIAPPA